MLNDKWFLVLCVAELVWLECGVFPAIVHSHSIHKERVEDGAYRSRDADHMKDGEHFPKFDHEAILGSSKEAKEFEELPLNESKRRLGLLLVKMDLNGDKYIDKRELKRWILNSFMKLSEEEARERFEEIDADQNNIITWNEYVTETYGPDAEFKFDDIEDNDDQLLIAEDRDVFNFADKNKDGILDIVEFAKFSNPEEYPEMHVVIIKRTLIDKDENGDGKISFKEFIGDRGVENDKGWIEMEKDKFDNDYDLDHDGYLSVKEIQGWMIPNNEDIADDEVEHLFASSDDDHDFKLSFKEVLDHHDTFVGSEATDYGDHLLGSHFDDEL